MRLTDRGRAVGPPPPPPPPPPVSVTPPARILSDRARGIIAVTTLTLIPFVIYFAGTAPTL